MSTPPTSTPWVPVWDLRPKTVVPTPINGKWATAAGGAVVWSDLPDPYSLVAGDTSWHIIGDPGEPQWTNGWNWWPDGNYIPPRFRRTNDGYVMLEGLIGYTGNAGQSAFTLPVGYRCGRSPRHFYSSQSAGTSWGSHWVYPSGEVVPVLAGAGTWISLNSIRFYASTT